MRTAARAVMFEPEDAGRAVRPWPPGDGEMARRIRAHNWAATPLGALELWPQSLKIAVELMLGSPQIAFLGWGSSSPILLYNDAYAAILGARHPAALGMAFAELWPQSEQHRAVSAVLKGEVQDFVDQAWEVASPMGLPVRWFTGGWAPLRDEAGQIAGFYAACIEITDRVLATTAQRDCEDRHAFFLKLSDVLRPLADPAEIGKVACRILAEHLGVGGACYGENGGAEAGVRVGEADASRSAIAAYRLPDFDWVLQCYRAKQGFVIDDVRHSELVPQADAATLELLGIRAALSVALVKEGALIGSLTVTHLEPRCWTQRDILLTRETGERIRAGVERTRTEAALRDSEARFRQFADASSNVLWIRDAATLAMEYVSPAFESVYGASRTLVTDEDPDPRRWAMLIVPDDRDAALAHLDFARRGEAVTHEFRIMRPSDKAFRWIRNTDFPLLDPQGRVQRVGGIASDVTEIKQAIQHQAVLLAELQHRTRNILAMIRALVGRTARTAGDVATYSERLNGRVAALARTQVLLTRAANAGVDLAMLIREELDAQASHEGQYVLTGPAIQLPPKATEVLALAVHELATNALKYGALSRETGLVTIVWRVLYESDRPWLRINWTETGLGVALEPPMRRGMGTELIERRVPYELEGRGSITIHPEGLACQIEFPIQAGDSILETSSVTLQSGIPGGALDMAGEADLSGCRILVVEDDYYLAGDTRRALEKVGATVLGPAPNATEAMRIIETGTPDLGVVDLNLGSGLNFAVAATLRQRGIPFVFVTGYDANVVPAEYRDIRRIQKPVELRQVVRSVAQLAEAAASQG